MMVSLYLTLKFLRGKQFRVVIHNYWGYLCEPCVQKFPARKVRQEPQKSAKDFCELPFLFGNIFANSAPSLRSPRPKISSSQKCAKKRKERKGFFGSSSLLKSETNLREFQPVQTAQSTSFSLLSSLHRIFHHILLSTFPSHDPKL